MLWAYCISRRIISRREFTIFSGLPNYRGNNNPLLTTRSKNKNNINKEIPPHFIPDKKSQITFPEKCMNAIGHV
jgi:hypothetical protein